MNDKIKEKLALYRLLLSFSLLGIFGIVGWIYRTYEKLGISETKLEFIVLFVFVCLTVVLFHRIIKLIGKL